MYININVRKRIRATPCFFPKKIEQKFIVGVAFFFTKTTLSFHVFFTFYYLGGGDIEKCPFTYWLNGRWYLQIVGRDSGKLYPPFPCSDF